MATFSGGIRKGLPRYPGGPGWPDVDGAVAAAPVAAPAAVPEAAPVEESVTAVAAAPPVAPAPAESVTLRSGLPRVPGGDPWPPAGTVAAAPVAPAAAPVVPEAAVPVAEPAPAAAASAGTFDTVPEERTLRQGLPRVAGGDPWPPVGTVSVQRAVAQHAAAEPAAPAAEPTPAPEPIAASVAAEPAPEPARAPLPATAPAAPAKPAKPKREPIMVGERTLGRLIGLVALWVVGAIVAAGIIVLAARGVTTLPGVPEFMKQYPGEYHLPDFVDPGFPWWARWSHFLNLFLMVLIIRSGLLVRQQQKPDAFYTPKKGGKKISIYLWLHTSLDVIWLANGVIFVVLLFVTGHWARIVPTSWETFPNAISAGLQYLTLEWPVEDGWVNYNSLQQLMYFVVIFIAAPLAAITGVRMSEWWPKDAEKLNRFYPAPLARAIHFPTMLFFVLFIIVHVFLVFTTGALKNLNHMFHGTPEVSWVGFWWFVAAVLVTAAVTWAARPLVLAPIAGAFGKVSER